MTRSSSQLGQEAAGTTPAASARLSLSRLAAQARYWLGEYSGENAYGRYLADWPADPHAACHTHARRGQPMTARQYFEHQLTHRYGATVSRCC